MYSLRVGGILRDSISKNIDRSSSIIMCQIMGRIFKKKIKINLSCNNRLNLFWPFKLMGFVFYFVL
jgi:hypothetical protein